MRPEPGKGNGFHAKTPKKAEIRQQVADAAEHAWTLIPNAEAELHTPGDRYLRYMLALAQKGCASQASPQDLIYTLPEIVIHPKALTYKPEVKLVYDADEQKDLNKKRKRADEYFRCLSSYFNTQLSKKLSRSALPDTVEELSADKQSSMKTTLRSIFGTVKDYWNQRDVPCSRRSMYSCPEAHLKLLSQSGMMYPALPAIYTINMLNRLLQLNTPSKQRLFQPSPVQEIAPHQQKDFFDGLNWMKAEITKSLAFYTNRMYDPIAYPVRKKERLTFDIGLSFLNDDNTPPASKVWGKAIPFAFPVCRLNKLADRLAALTGLSAEEQAALLSLLPDAIYAPSVLDSRIKEQFSDAKASKIISVLTCFRSLVKPDCYNNDTKSRKKRHDIINTLYKSGLVDNAPVQIDEKAEELFLSKFFTYSDITDTLIAMRLSDDYMYSDKLELPGIFEYIYDNIPARLTFLCLDKKKETSKKHQAATAIPSIPAPVLKRIMKAVTWEQVDGILASREGSDSINPTISSIINAESSCKLMAQGDPDGFYKANQVVVEKIQMKAIDMVARRCTAVLLRAYFENYGLIASDGK